MVPGLMIPEQWREVAHQICYSGGKLMVIGDPDVGKSTFCLVILQTAYRLRKTALFIDSDPGQSTVGPPCMIDLAMSQSYPDNFERLKHLSSHFVGNTSPAGVMLQILVGLKDLLEEATRLTPHVIVIDTTSMNKGELGFELKYHKIRLLLPDTIIAIQQGHELEHLLRPWEGSERIKIIRIPASPFTISRSFEHRRQNRHESYLRYFSSAVELKVPLGRLANYNLYEPLENRTAGIYSKDGRCLGLGIILKVEPDLGDMTLLTPVRQRESIWIVRTGKLKLSRECQEII